MIKEKDCFFVEHSKGSFEAEKMCTVPGSRTTSATPVPKVRFLITIEKS
jgi:hypothetical protein